ncbi:uncharacterized protein LOC5521666 [Nematostella vectensis]|nr:uncharacterized protein LOC5521666 [Nematostella vectensis]
MSGKVAMFLALFALCIGIYSVDAHALKPRSLHASCTIHWQFKLNCSHVNEAIVTEIKALSGDAGCKNGGEKCLYILVKSSPEEVKAIHETPKKHYKDDLTFTFTSSSDSACAVKGYSTSELWYAILDYGTNYCNLHNLITGSGLDKTEGYVEETSDSVCTQYSKRNCDKY